MSSQEKVECAGLGAPYLGCEHVHDPIHRPAQQEAPHQEANQHHVGEERAEVHHLGQEGCEEGTISSTARPAPQPTQEQLNGGKWGVPFPK